VFSSSHQLVRTRERRPSRDMLHKLIVALSDAHARRAEIDDLVANAKADTIRQQFGDLP
jgi:hypothetical protein